MPIEQLTEIPIFGNDSGCSVRGGFLIGIPSNRVFSSKVIGQPCDQIAPPVEGPVIDHADDPVMGRPLSGSEQIASGPEEEEYVLDQVFSFRRATENAVSYAEYKSAIPVKEFS